MTQYHVNHWDHLDRLCCYVQSITLGHNSSERWCLDYDVRVNMETWHYVEYKEWEEDQEPRTYPALEILYKCFSNIYYQKCVMKKDHQFTGFIIYTSTN